MRILSLSLLFSLTIVLVTFLTKVQETDSIYAYAIKGIVKDLRLHPTTFIGSWFFKKAFILKKLKLKWKLKKKLILKKLLLKKKLFLGLLLKSKGKGGIKIFAPKIIVSPFGFVGRKKRAVRFPEDDHSSSSSSQSHHGQHSQSYQSQEDGFHYSQYFQNLNMGSLGLSQTDLEQLRQLPDSLKNEYGQEMHELETAASEPREEEIQDYLSMASEFDESACIPRIICEIMAKGNQTSNQFENQILDYYNDPGNMEKKSGTPAYTYDYAAYTGKTTRNPRNCASYFPNCPDASQTLKTLMNEVFNGPESCDSPFTNSESNTNNLGLGNTNY